MYRNLLLGRVAEVFVAVKAQNDDEQRLQEGQAQRKGDAVAEALGQLAAAHKGDDEVDKVDDGCQRGQRFIAGGRVAQNGGGQHQDDHQQAGGVRPYLAENDVDVVQGDKGFPARLTKLGKQAVAADGVADVGNQVNQRGS